MKKVIASIITIVLSIPLFVSTPLANAVSQSYTTGYGSYYFTYNNDLDTFLVTFGNLGGIYMKGYCQTLTYEFNDTYSGYLDIHLLSESIFMNATVITENCYVKGKNSSQWDYSIGFKDVTSIKVTIVLPTMSTNNSWSGNKMALTTNYNITRDVTTVEDYLEDIETTLGLVDAQLSTMNNSLSQLLTLEEASRTLLSEIEYAIRGNNSLYVLSNDMGTIITDLNSIIANCSEILSTLQQQRWYMMQAMKYAANMQDLNAYKLFGNSSQLYYDDFMPYYKFGTIKNNARGIYVSTYQKYYLIVGFKPNVSENTIFTDYQGNPITCSAFRLNRQDYSQLCLYEINVNRNWFTIGINSTNDDLCIYPYYWGPANQLPKEYAQIFGIEYTDSYTRKMDEIKNAINNMNVNVNNLTVNATGITYNVNNTQVNNSVTTYNTNINQVYNIENSFGTQLDTQLQNYNPDNTTIISRLTASGNIMSTVLNGINGIELFTVPISVMLVGIVLLAIVG